MKKKISEYEEAYARTHLEFWEEEVILAEDPNYPIDYKDNPQKKLEYKIYVRRKLKNTEIFCIQKKKKEDFSNFLKRSKKI